MTIYTAIKRAATAGLFLAAIAAATTHFATGTLRAADDKPAVGLPLSKVVLFSSGVGFYEHKGQVQGDAKIDLRFNVQEINDLLKSMVLQDLGGGKISTVTYGSKDPVTKTLKTFAIDLTTNPTLADILRQIRGEKVQVEAPTPIMGTILGVEKHKIKVGKDETTEVEMLNLLTSEGLRSVSLEQVTRIKLVDEKLNAELQQALSLLAASHSTDKKTVTLNFLGAGKRDVSVGYIQESPIWKTSYRLVLKDDEAPFLQGWAIVENATEQDWKDVNLTLVSGRPISFIMDLYQPLYVKRPVVEPELYASLRPQTYNQDLAGKDRDFKRMAAGEKKAGQGALPGGDAAEKYFRRDEKGKAENGIAADDQVDKLTEAAFDPTAGVRSAAEAGNVGELFRYVIATPVTLPRQQSAMLPIVNESVKGEKVSIYNQSVQAKHPLNGLKFTNSTDLHLMQGPITVFDGGAYAGDAKIEDLQPKSERLISYALDLDTEVAPESKSHPEQLTSVSIVKGTLHASRKYTRTQKYVIKNGGKKAKKVLVEYPFDANWKLTAPKEPAEKTRNMYRFAVNAEPGKPTTLEVDEEQMQNQSWALTNLDDNSILFYIQAKEVGPEVKKALQEVIRRKTAIQDVANKRQLLQSQIQVVEQEQARIRQNMAQLDRTSDLYNRYVKKFGEQEDQVDSLRKQIQALNEEEVKLRKDLNDYLSKLDIAA